MQTRLLKEMIQKVNQTFMTGISKIFEGTFELSKY